MFDGSVSVVSIVVVPVHVPQVECKKAQPKEVMFPPGTRGRARGLPYTMDAFMLGMGMLSKFTVFVHVHIAFTLETH